MIQNKGNYVYDVKITQKRTEEAVYRVIARSEEEAQKIIESASRHLLSEMQTDLSGWVESVDYEFAEVGPVVEGASC